MVTPPNLETQLRSANVGDDLINLLCVEDNLDVQSFGLLALTLHELDTRMQSIAEELLRELSRKEIITLLQIWTNANAKETVASPANDHQPHMSSGNAASSWAETFPPKLTGSAIRQLRLDYESSYPSELLPGPRLLALTHAQLSKKEWKWIHWRMRLSQSQHDNHVSTRPKKLAKIESLAMQDLILDDVPQRELPTQLGIAQLTQLLTLQAVAIALCKGAHLHVLKQYVQKFVRLATTRYDADANLRGPNTQEMMHADQMIWQKNSDLFNLRDWTLDDCFHELTDVRSDLEALLQPRPMSRAPAPSQPAKGKGKGSKGKGKFKSKQQPTATVRQQWVTEMQKDGKNSTLCLRFNQGTCKDPQCRYAHACCVAKPNGQACGGSHSALQHNATPH